MKIRHCEKEESIYTREQAVRSVREARVRAVRGVRAIIVCLSVVVLRSLNKTVST
ncbi:hypothetical protein T08_10450 [Trichinella sp. T8]|nr:hypothetical protein T08_10450 [Trichinella sp. T8]